MKNLSTTQQFMIITFMIASSNFVHASLPPSSETIIIKFHLELQAVKAAQQFLISSDPEIFEIKKTEQAIDTFINNIQKHRQYPPDVVAQLRKQFRRTVLQDQRITWKTLAQKHARMQPVPKSSEEINLATWDFQQEFSIPYVPEYISIIETFKETLQSRIRRSSQRALSADPRIRYGTHEEELLFTFQTGDEHIASQQIQTIASARTWIDEQTTHHLSWISEKTSPDEITRILGDMDYCLKNLKVPEKIKQSLLKTAQRKLNSKKNNPNFTKKLLCIIPNPTLIINPATPAPSPDRVPTPINIEHMSPEEQELFLDNEKFN